MKHSAARVDFGILQQVFADIANDKNPVEHLLVLTYEFDDQQLANLLSGQPVADNFDLRRNHLKFIADMNPVIVYDARKTRDFNQLPHFLNLLPVNSGAYRCHHTKAYLFVKRDSVRLLLGSFNLTRGGLFENREVFTDFQWSKSATDNLDILRDFSRLLRDGYAQWAQPAAAAARIVIANVLDARHAQWQKPSATNKCFLLPSGYKLHDDQHGLQRLAVLWRRVSDAPPDKVLAVTPFFDQGKECFADALAKAVGVPSQLHIVSDEEAITKLGRRHYGPGARNQVRNLSLISKVIKNNERERISGANDGARVEGLQLNRRLHAKILILCSGKDHLVYAGSANFTLKAWNGHNQELGVAEIKAGSADKLISNILEAFAVEPSNAYERLGEGASDPQATDDEDYIEQAGYPEFIEAIQLEGDPGGRGLVFRFLTDEPELLQRYDVYWGRVHLSIEGCCANPIVPEKAYMPLHGGRNLRFTVCNAPNLSYLLPFVHDAALTRQQDILLFPSSEDWLNSYQLTAGRPRSRDENEYLPGENDTAEQSDASTAERESNVVIAMQSYLNLFAGVEATFHKRAQEIATPAIANSSTRAEECERRIAEPLRVCASLLGQEYKRKSGSVNDEVYLFRLGELILLCRSLAKLLPELMSLACEMAERLNVPATNSASLAYTNFIREQLRYARTDPTA